MTFYNHIFKMNCSCPYDENCKHLYAIILYLNETSKLKKEIRDYQSGLSTNYQLFSISKLDLSEKLTNFIDNLNNNNNHLTIFLTIKDYFNKINFKELEELTDFIYDRYKVNFIKNSDYVSLIKYFCSYKLDIRNKILEKLNIKEKLFPLIQLEDKNLINNNDILLFYLINDDLIKLKEQLNYIIKYDFKISKNIALLLLSIFDQLDNNQKNELANYLSNILNKDELFYLFNKLNNSELRKNILFKLSPLTYTSIKKLALKEDEEGIAFLYLIKSDRAKYLFDTYALTLLKNNKETELLFELVQLLKDEDINLYEEDAFFKTINLLPNNDFIKIYFSSLYQFNFKDNEFILPIKILNINKKDNIVEKDCYIASIEHYFDLLINCHQESSTYTFDFALKNSNNYILFSYIFDDKIVKFVSKCNNKLYNKKDITNYITNYLSYLLTNSNELGKKIETILKNIQTIREKREIDSLNEELSLNYLSYLKGKNKNKILRIIPSIDTNNLIINYKIGYEKFYKVPSTKILIERFLNKNTIKYGTQLIKHDFDKLNQKSKDLLFDLFSSINEDEILNSDELYLNKKGQINYLTKVINIYKNDQIYLNDELYNVSFAPLNLKIKIKKDKKLSITNIPVGNFLIKGTPYLYNKEEKNIFLATKSDLINGLVAIISSSLTPSIKDHETSFKYQYLLEEKDSFLIDSDSKKAFEFETLNISTYFDLNKNVLSYEYRIFKNGEEIHFFDLNKEEKSIIDNYSMILISYGFIDQQLKDNNLIFEFLTSSLNDLKKYSTIYFSQAILNKKITNFSLKPLKINYNSGLLKIFLEESTFNEEELYEIAKAIKLNKKFVLINDQILTLNNEASTKFSELVDDLNLIDKKKIKKETTLPIYYLFKNKLLEENDNSDQYLNNLVNDLTNFKNLNLKIPTSIKADLRTYQKEGYYWLSTLYKYHLGGILADDMGLGKTLETITFIASLDIKQPILIISPTSLIFNREQ